MAENRDCALSTRISCTLRAALEHAAAQDDRTVLKYVERVLVEHIDKVAKGKRKRT